MATFALRNLTSEDVNIDGVQIPEAASANVAIVSKAMLDAKTKGYISITPDYSAAYTNPSLRVLDQRLAYTPSRSKSYA